MKLFKNIFLFFFSFSIGLFIWGIIFLFLEKKPIIYNKILKNYDYFNINLVPLFFNKTSSNTNIKMTYLKNIKLKGIYKNGKEGFIIIENNGKTIFIDMNKNYKGYKLIKIGTNFAILSKNGNKYKIEFNMPKKQIYKSEQISNFIIKKNIFEKYKKDLTKVWKNIGIINVKDGYKITYIKPNSIFDKIGLKEGDILLEINGIRLISDSEVWNLYKNIDNIKNFEIKIKRKNQEKVLYYEIQ